MEEHARSLARAQAVKPQRQLGHPLLDRLAANEASLIDSYRSICAAVDDKAAITPAAEWLIDNFYLVERQIREVRLDLPPAYYRQLPKLADGPFAGLPRVFGLVWAFVAHTDSRFDVDTWCAFIHAYQEEQPLTIGELWASAITLRIILVENLRRIAERIVYSRDERRKADAIADHLFGADGPDDGRRTGRRARPGGAVRRARGSADSSAEGSEPGLYRNARPARRTAGGGRTDGRQRDPRRAAKADRGQCHGAQHHHQHAAYLRCRLVGHLRTRLAGRPRARQGLRFREDGFCDAQPLSHGGRDSSPEGRGLDELEVANRAIEAAAAATERRRKDPGYYLTAEGRPAFEAALGFRPPFSTVASRAYRALGVGGYAGAGALVALLLLGFPVFFHVEASVDWICSACSGCSARCLRSIPRWRSSTRR